MPKWERSKQDDRRQIQGVEDGRYIGHAIIPADADAICRAHNADIDALTAERDELQRRLDACLVEAERVGGQAEREIRAIAEGREG